jgi:hypothetical protein
VASRWAASALVSAAFSLAAPGPYGPLYALYRRTSVRPSLTTSGADYCIQRAGAVGAAQVWGFGFVARLVAQRRPTPPFSRSTLL